MAGVRNLTQVEAAERARLLDVTGYDISLDLTDGTGGRASGTFRSTTEVRFRCAEPGATTFIEVAAERCAPRRSTAPPVDLAGWSAEKGLTLTGLAAENTLVVDADFALLHQRARACTAASTRSTRRSTSTASSRRPTRSGCSPASTSPT